MRVCAEGPHDHRPGHNHKTDHKLCNEKIRTRIRYLGVQLVMDVRVVWSKVMRTVGAGETVEEIVDKLIETANRRPLQRRPSNSVKRTRDTATQENFELRRQLDLAEETSGAVIAELQAEISQLKEKIIERNQRGSSEHFLREEIERLNFQLAESGQTNDSLTRELKTVNESLRREKISMEELAQDSKSRVSERNILAEKKEDLEKQVLILKLEKDSLSNSLENAVSKIGSMERKQQDQENVMRLSEREVEELKTSNNYLLEKLELCL